MTQQQRPLHLMTQQQRPLHLLTQLQELLHLLLQMPQLLRLVLNPPTLQQARASVGLGLTWTSGQPQVLTSGAGTWRRWAARTGGTTGSGRTFTPGTAAVPALSR